MAAAVARSSSSLHSSISLQEKGSRNKRKFRAEPPPTDLNMLPPMQNDRAGYDLSPTEKALDNTNLEHHPILCDLCRFIAYGPGKELDLNVIQDADWGDLTEAQLEEMLLSNLDMIFKSAIKKVASHGYPEEVASNAVLSMGFCYGCKDILTNIVEKALAYLKSGQETDSSLNENFNEDLQKLEKSVLMDMIGVLREVQPFFSMGDAMWCLLICDMDVSRACAMEGDLLNGVGNEETSTGVSTMHPSEMACNSNSSSGPTMPEFDRPVTNELNASLPFPRRTQLPISDVSPGPFSTPNCLNDAIPNLNTWKETKMASSSIVVEESTALSVSQSYGRFSASGHVHSTLRNLHQGNDNLMDSTDQIVENFSSLAISQSSLPEQKPTGSRKGHVSSSKRDSILRQKSIHFEKNYRAFTKAALRAGKHNGFGGLMLDKKCKSLPDSSSINLKSASLKISKMVATNRAQVDAVPNLSFTAGSSASLSYSMGSFTNPPPLTLANTELSLSLPSTSTTDLSAKPNCCIESANCSNLASIRSGVMSEQLVLQDRKDEELLKLVPCVRELQAQLQDWNDWAQQKVRQATRRLGKDQSELRTLRQEKEEVARLRKEKQSLEENSMKKLSEMENALSKAGGQVDRANDAIRRLEVENSELRQQMEAAKLRAAKSAASCQEVSRREMDTNKKFQLREREMALLQEELVSDKRKLSQLQQQLEQEKDHRGQLEAKWRQEESVKAAALKQVSVQRKEREQIEVSGKSKDDELRLKAINDLQKHKDDIGKLEQQISQLRLMTDSSKIAALKWGMDGSYASRVVDVKKDRSPQFFTKISDFLENDDEDVQRERECVMCLTEEMSVVFLPCAHQVVCEKCSGLHEKQGMSDCPSCRALIQRRICVRSADA